MNDILQKIIAVKREEIAAGQKKIPLPAMRADAGDGTCGEYVTQADYDGQDHQHAA